MNLQKIAQLGRLAAVEKRAAGPHSGGGIGGPSKLPQQKASGGSFWSWRNLARMASQGTREPTGPGKKTVAFANAVMNRNPQIYGKPGKDGFRDYSSTGFTPYQRRQAELPRAAPVRRAGQPSGVRVNREPSKPSQPWQSPSVRSPSLQKQLPAFDRPAWHAPVSSMTAPKLQINSPS